MEREIESVEVVIAGTTNEEVLVNTRVTPRRQFQHEGRAVATDPMNAADDAHKVIRMGQVRHMPSAIECVSPRMWKGFLNCVENRSRRTAGCARDQRRRLVNSQTYEQIRPRCRQLQNDPPAERVSDDVRGAIC